MNEVVKAYVAALVDGEGSVCFTRPVKHGHRVPIVTIASTTLALLTYVKDNFNGVIIEKKVYKTHHKKSWTWSISYRKAIGFLTAILPYMREPEKRRRAQLLVSRYVSCTPRNGKYSAAQLKAKKALESEFYLLPGSKIGGADGIAAVS